jgi:hypothetical protein
MMISKPRTKWRFGKTVHMKKVIGELSLLGVPVRYLIKFEIQRYRTY